MSEPVIKKEAKILLLEVGEEGTQEHVDMLGMFRVQTTQTLVNPEDAFFLVDIEGSMDNDHWVSFGSIGESGFRTESEHAVQFIKATLTSVEPGAKVTVFLSWA
jgi:hypothetical protein